MGLIPVLRERYGTRFVFLFGSEKVRADYGHVIGPDDETLIMPKYAELVSQRSDLSDEHELAAAWATENRYGLCFYKDLVQQDRALATGFMGVAPGSVFHSEDHPRAADLARAANAAIEFAEELFDRHDFDFCLAWPLSVADACIAAVAEKRDVLVTYPYPAKHKRLGYWASGPYSGPLQHRAAFDEEPDGPPMADSEISTSGRPAHLEHSRLDALYSFPSTLKRCAIVVFHRLEFLLIDIRAGRPFRSRKSRTLKAISSHLRAWRFYRRFNRLCERDVDVLSARPFVLFAFMQEPEFSVQGRAKEFNDQEATIRQIALSLPPGVDLVIKEHATLGNRTIDYYNELLAFPNVRMAHPSIPAVELIKRAEAVASLGGTVTVEAAILGSPSLIFSVHTEFEVLPSVTLVRSFIDLPAILRDALRPRTEAEREAIRRDGARFRRALERFTFDADGIFRRDDSVIDVTRAERAADMLVQLLALWRAERQPAEYAAAGAARHKEHRNAGP